MLNQEMRTVTMSRADMCRIRTALTSVMLSFDEGSSSREMWKRIRADLIAQISIKTRRMTNKQTPAPEVTRAEGSTLWQTIGKPISSWSVTAGNMYGASSPRRPKRGFTTSSVKGPWKENCSRRISSPSDDGPPGTGRNAPSGASREPVGTREDRRPVLIYAP